MDLVYMFRLVSQVPFPGKILQCNEMIFFFFCNVGGCNVDADRCAIWGMQRCFFYSS